MSLKMNQWTNNRIHCFLQNYVKIGTFSTLCFGEGTSSKDLDLKQSMQYQTRQMYLRVYPAWCTLSSCKQWQNASGHIWMYLVISGHIWMYPDASGSRWLRQA